MFFLYSIFCFQNFCPRVVSLKLAWCTGITDDSLASLAKLSKVSELDLSLTSITSLACPLLREMKQLRFLDVSATKIYNEGAQQMFTETSRLEGLTLRFIEDLTIGSLQLILERAPKLKLLDVTHSGELGDGSIRKTEPFQRLIKEKNIQVPGLLLTPSITCRQRPHC
jgi:Leucine-rich repeat (LRR) protein